jgi:hypothetical protein
MLDFTSFKEIVFVNPVLNNKKTNYKENEDRSQIRIEHYSQKNNKIISILTR